MRRRLFITIVLALGAFALPASAQDVEMFGRRYGTRPPQAYFDRMSRDPGAFQFRRGRSQRLRADFRAVGGGGGGGGGGGPLLALGRRSAPVAGTFVIPVLLGLYENTPPTATPPTREALDDGYFGTQPGTIRDYYSEVSGGRATVVGDVRDWTRVSLPDTIVTLGVNGLTSDSIGGGGPGNFIWELLTLHPEIDWRPFDNDGPDGIANSGDDDGFVDVLAVVHPTPGGECAGGAGRVWSHFWSVSSARRFPERPLEAGPVFVTTSPAAGGGFIMIDDYAIVPSLACSGGGLNEIGVFTHELGHAFGLPDLYDTSDEDGRHDGVGVWDLMGSGAWGCAPPRSGVDPTPETPCHMGAWTKEQLGWADVVQLAADTDHGVVRLPPVETTGTVYRVDAGDGSGEYFLLENRQAIGYDANLVEEGLLVWHVDPDWVAGRWEANVVNGAAHMGVWLRQADGRDDLGLRRGARGDGGDPFPGATGNTEFHAASNPAAVSHLGGATGATLTDIALEGEDVRFRLSTRFTTVTLTATGTSSSDGIFLVDGQPVDPPATGFRSAPFEPRTVEAAAGEATAPGERRAFLEWGDAPAAPRVRAFVTPFGDTELEARYGGVEYELALVLEGGVAGVAPATVVTTPASEDLWFAPDTRVTVEAVPLTGFDFLGWTGALEGQPNPAELTLAAPASAGARFELVYGVATTAVEVTATIEQDLQLETANGTPPYTWSVVGGALPLGLGLSGTGRITGASIDLGTFPVTLEAVDLNGLPAQGQVTFEVRAPSIAIEALTSPFLLTGPPLTPVQEDFLDRQGNGTGGYDLGDFRAWVLANPSLPLSASFEAAPGPRKIVISMGSNEGGQGR